MRYILLILICISFKCSNDIAGGTSTTDNPMMVGVILGQDNQPAADALVLLIPNRYNPVTDEPIPPSMRDTTDSLGQYRFVNLSKTSYSIEAFHPESRTRLLIQNISINLDTTIVPSDLLQESGLITLILPDTVDTAYGYVFLVGTSIYKELSAISSQPDGSYLVYIDSVPASAFKGAYYNVTNGTGQSEKISDSFTVFAGDSVIVEALIFWRVFTKENTPLTADVVRYVAWDSENNAWCGTSGGGIAFYDGTDWTIFDTLNSGLSSNFINVLAVDKNDHIWACTEDGGIARFDRKNWIVYDSVTAGLPGNGLHSLAFDSSGNKWFGLRDAHVAKYDGNTWEFFDSTNSALLGTIVSSIAVDSRGNVWVSVFNGGLFKYDGTNWVDYTMSNSQLPDNVINNMSIDNSDILWISSNLGNVTRFDGNSSWQIYDDSLFPGDRIYSVSVEMDSTIWITNDAGFPVRLNDGNITILKNYTHNGYYDGIAAIFIDKRQNKWGCRFPNQGGGVVVFGPSVYQDIQ